MSPDSLDDLLDNSGPRTVAAATAELDAMIADARREVPVRRRVPRVAIGVGLAALLVGGASVAVATDGFDWAPWAQDPVGAVGFTMATGFDCELRFSEYTAGSDAAFLSDVNRTLRDWYRTTDVVTAARQILPDVISEYELEAMYADAGEPPIASLPVDEAQHRQWAQEWLAWDLAVSELETEALRNAGFPIPDERFVGSERSGQIQCFDEDHEPYVPGVGS